MYTQSELLAMNCHLCARYDDDSWSYSLCTPGPVPARGAVGDSLLGRTPWGHGGVPLAMFGRDTVRKPFVQPIKTRESGARPVQGFRILLGAWLGANGCMWRARGAAAPRAVTTAPDRVPGCGGGQGRPLLPARGRTVATLLDTRRSPSMNSILTLIEF
jgi:hypothetical protein